VGLIEAVGGCIGAFEIPHLLQNARAREINGLISRERENARGGICVFFHISIDQSDVNVLFIK
jgi:hypothetical protein